MARIGIFGGTFNPIHVGHLTLAEEARLSAGLDRILLIPSGESYLKDPRQIAPRQDRLQMARLACAGRYEVSDLEIRREGPSYTAVTCAELRAMYPEDALVLILGADSLMEIGTRRPSSTPRRCWPSPGAARRTRRCGRRRSGCGGSTARASGSGTPSTWRSPPRTSGGGSGRGTRSGTW